MKIFTLPKGRLKVVLRRFLKGRRKMEQEIANIRRNRWHQDFEARRRAEELANREKARAAAQRAEDARDKVIG